MRTFHTGGIASAEDITQGLPRVEELFESRRPKSMAIMSEISGVVSQDDTKKNVVIPLAYLGSREASFGPRSEVITRTSYVCVWILLALAGIVFSKFMGPVWKHSSFWNWPTFGRDIVFIILMYIELCLTMAGAYVQTRLMGKTEGRGL